MTQCGTIVARLYQNVIDEVIAASRENFLDESVDEQVLNDLKQQWEAKIALTKAAEHSELNLTPVSQAIQQHSHVPAPTIAMVPVQITVPSQQTGGAPKTITIHVPSGALSSGLAGVQLQNILGSPSAAQTFALDPSQAADIIQRQLNTALQQNGVAIPTRLLNVNQSVSQVDGSSDTPLQSQPMEYKISASRSVLDKLLLRHLSKKQIDGAFGLGDSSDEISDDDDDDDEDEEKEDKNGNEEDVDDDEEVEEEGGLAEDPLNSEDDVSDDGGELFETENVVVCQYDRITRVRNKWKFHLKDGIMHLKSKDYVFTKAVGEGEW